MIPVITGFGSFWHVWALPVSVLVGVLVLLRTATVREGLPARAVLTICLTLAVSAFVGGHVWWMLQAGVEWTPSTVMNASLRAPGAVLGMGVGVLILLPFHFRKISVGALADSIVPAAMIAIPIARVQCLLAACCYGIPSDLPWAIQHSALTGAGHNHAFRAWVLDGDPTLPVHPLAIYFVFLALFSGALALSVRKRRTYPGQVFLVFVFIHETGKALIETLRDPGLLPANESLQLASIVFASVALLTLVIRAGLCAGLPENLRTSLARSR